MALLHGRKSESRARRYGAVPLRALGFGVAVSGAAVAALSCLGSPFSGGFVDVAPMYTGESAVWIG